ncbi:hypothetical protein AGABI1DRAFT_124751 [Agaricus bisporus var. burnettii JB137-S8]|uniref:Uncharacterized protein n=1 Tax=Agaricus bisporus var. burnettii (strain JB137-S8 / ATCC MYA-4627 / FGSC 10392) TaxID=597362 RepID=K5XLI3_AGABU|nr:uncharacterized protein AGABI1DRAFT_124751 [Agaricus bisporus var. burnettii JB137-S8]EKM84443.1 hypothetical protein AGABI1DRAFT_124751 [Agaricus bisporus var. burnettii JB137-S8]
MNFLSGNKNQNESQGTKKEGGGGLMGKVNETLGGGQAGEKKEDPLDKGVDFVQQHVMGQGPQNNEEAAEQAKDETISDSIRKGYKGATGSDFPVADK